MVMETKVPCVRFGQPPDRNKPQPRFPGVSAAFDPSAAVVVYTDIVKKEKEMLAEGLLMVDRASKAKRRSRRVLADPVVAVQKQLGDLLPGYASLGDFCQHLGYLRHPTSGGFVPDESVSALSAQTPEDVASVPFREAASGSGKRSVPSASFKSGGPSVPCALLSGSRSAPSALTEPQEVKEQHGDKRALLSSKASLRGSKETLLPAFDRLSLRRRQKLEALLQRAGGELPQSRVAWK